MRLGLSIHPTVAAIHFIMGKRNRITEQDYIKAVKRADRMNEIQCHGKLISTRPTRTHQSKKAYRRSRYRNIKIDEN